MRLRKGVTASLGVLALAFACAGCGASTPSATQGVQVISGKAYRLSSPVTFAAAGPNIWVSGAGLTGITASTGRLFKCLAVGGRQLALGVDGTALWAYSDRDHSFVEIDGSSGVLLSQVRVDARTMADPFSMVVAGHEIWSVGGNLDHPPHLAEIDVASKHARILSWLPYPSAVASGGGSSIWVYGPNKDGVTSDMTELSSPSGRIERQFPLHISFDGFLYSREIQGSLWILFGNHIDVVSTRNGHLTTLERRSFGFDGSSFMTADADHAWVSDSYSNAVTEIDVKTLSVVRIYRGPRYHLEGPHGIIVFDGKVWIANNRKYPGSVVDFPTG